MDSKLNLYHSWISYIVIFSLRATKKPKLMSRKRKITLMKNLASANRVKAGRIEILSPARPKKVFRVETKENDKFEVISDPKPAKHFTINTVIGRKRKRKVAVKNRKTYLKELQKERRRTEIETR